LSHVTLQYFDDCPNWRITERHLSTLVAEGVDATVAFQLIDSYDNAIKHGFRGSPTVLVDGVDPFAHDEAPLGLSCRIYDTESGPSGSPSLEQLRAVIAPKEEN
jgi:hypothetical protein